MRYADIKKLLEQDNSIVDIILYFEDGTDRIVREVPRSATEEPSFFETISRYAMSKFNKVVERWGIVGEGDTQGNPDGETPDTDNPTVITSPNNDEDEIEQRPNFTDVSIMHPNELAAMQYSAQRRRTIDRDGDNVNDETGEALPIIYSDGTLRNPDNLEEIVGTVPGYVEPISGAGDPGEEGEEGEEGEIGGGMTTEMAANLAEKMYNAFNPKFIFRWDRWGTVEKDILEVFEVCANKGQLNAVAREYEERYDENMYQRLLEELNFITTNTGFDDIRDRWIELANEELTRLGFRIDGEDGRYRFVSE